MERRPVRKIASTAVEETENSYRLVQNGLILTLIINPDVIFKGFQHRCKKSVDCDPEYGGFSLPLPS